MNDKNPRTKIFLYWYRLNIILSITIYEYVFNIHCKDICMSFIVKSVIECFAMIYTLVFNDALKKTSAYMSRRSRELF